MAKRSEHISRFKTDQARLLEILVNEDFQVQREKAQGAVSASVTNYKRTDNQVTYDVHTVEYAKGITGVDKTKTETADAHYTWNLATKTCEWTYQPNNAFASKVKVWGSMKMRTVGEETELYSDFNINIGIPLIGGKAESMVLAEVEPGWARHDEVVVEFLKKS